MSRTSKNCVVIGGGPSVDPAMSGKIKYDIIAVNSALQDFPEAKAFVCSDIRWLKWGNNLEIVKNFRRLKIMRCPKESYDLQGLEDVGLIFSRKNKSRSENLSSLGGICSGGAAINLAYILGYEKIYLLGFDMKSKNGKYNYHDNHRAPGGGNYKDFTSAICKMNIPGLINLSVDSNLRCCKFGNIEEIL